MVTLGPRQLCGGTQLIGHDLGEGASSLKPWGAPETWANPQRPVEGTVALVSRQVQRSAGLPYPGSPIAVTLNLLPTHHCQATAWRPPRTRGGIDLMSGCLDLPSFQPESKRTTSGTTVSHPEGLGERQGCLLVWQLATDVWKIRDTKPSL